MTPRVWREYVLLADSARGTGMKWHPILMSAPMILALKARRKFVTRRTSASWLKVKRGDGLWVRETFCIVNDTDTGGDKWIDYRATPRYSSEHPAGWENAPDDPDALKWKPSIHMPRLASRFSLIATADAWREQLQDISRSQAVDEGIEPVWINGERMWKLYDSPPAVFTDDSIDSFRSLVNSLHGPNYWDSNPEVTVIPFDYPEKS